ncbi:MAG: LL-diaminopimelate aminotransferase [Actinomycetota bacterium]|nr:LL-diaminopimelate aminotransferase [Actinomycetota bacterium]
MRLAKRIGNLPPYLFAQLDKKIEEKKARGIDVINLGIGDPIEPTPTHIINKLCKEAHNPANHRYPSYYGMLEFRRAIAEWYEKRFKVHLDPETEILPLIGSKEGIAHIFLALVDPGDISLIPDPGYPVYNTGTILAGGVPHFMPLLAENDFIADLSAIDKNVANRARIMFLNYPNNPTSAIVKEGFFEKVVDFAKTHGTVVCHDNPYSEITFDGYIAPSFLQTPGAIDVGVEFHSLSKTYNMTGWRIGWIAGNARVIEALGKVKTNVDSGIFNAIQYAGIEALQGPQSCIREMCQIYARRRDMVIDTLNKIGIGMPKPKATIYIWVAVPGGQTSAEFATIILEKAGVVVAPGSAYGPSGEGYIRISLTVKDDRLEEALERMEKALK